MKSASSALDATQSWWLLGAAAAALLPLLPHLPPWLVAAGAVVLGLRAWLIRTQGAPPARWVLALAVFAGMVGIVAQYHMPIGQNPGVALLVILLGLKQLESVHRRDAFASVLLCYFLLLSTLFYSQTIANAAALFAGVGVTTGALGALADSRQPPLRLLRLSGLMLLQAVPLLLIMFVLFPRIAGPLWSLPRDAHSTQSGLSDSMTPGSIASVALSDAIAFRAKFAGSPPPRAQLYWRGPVLTLFDGRTWRPGQFGTARALPYPVAGRTSSYEVTLEPHNGPWLFALEFPSELPADAAMAGDYQLLARTPVTQRRRYDVASRLGMTPGADEFPRVLRQAVAVPRGNPRTLALGRSWRANYASDRDILKAALAFFARQGLGYTLTPPPLSADDVDGFLFDTRQGFCEHFAGAFVLAMRAAGVPARVVTGYLGGELNPVDGYFEIRQSDAHAWAEVWLAQQGWTRVDPTAASFPLRIADNLAAVVPGSDALPLLMRADWPWLHDMRQRLDALANHWNQWVLGYNPQRQRDLLSRLGMPSPDWRRMTMTLTVLCAAVSLVLAAWALHRRRRVDPVLAQWLRATARLARRGLPRHPWEGPRDYAERIAAARPEFAPAIREIAELYRTLRYGRGDPQAIAHLRSRVAAFRP